MSKGIGTGIQTNPPRGADSKDGTVLVVLEDGVVREVVSDLNLDVQVCDIAQGEGYSSSPSRPLWEFLRKATAKLLKDRE